MFPNLQPPAKYTGEAFGVLYLSLICKDEDLAQLIEDSNNTATVVPSGVDTTLLLPFSDAESNDDKEVYYNNIIFHLYVYRRRYQNEMRLKTLTAFQARRWTSWSEHFCV